MSKNKYIGIFDSGLGGLTVAKAIMESMPNENIVYFGDTAHVPYGTKSSKEIIGFVKEDIRFLTSFDVKAIVIACNTADSVARKEVEPLYDLPIFGVVDPASKVAASVTKNRKVGVIATNATVSSHAYLDAIRKYDEDIEVFEVAAPLLVPLVEEGRFSSNDEIVDKIVEDYLEPLFNANIDTLVLGCTHYPLLYDVFKSKMPFVNILSSSDIAAAAVKNALEESDLLSDTNNGDHRYYVSGDEVFFEKQASIFMDNLEGKVEHIESDQ